MSPDVTQPQWPQAAMASLQQHSSRAAGSASTAFEAS